MFEKFRHNTENEKKEIIKGVEEYESDKQDSREYQEMLDTLVKFKELLKVIPEYYYSGGWNFTVREDIVELVLTNNDGEEKVIKLDQQREEYGHGLINHEDAETTVAQIAKEIAVNGIPEKIRYTKINIEDWSDEEHDVVNEHQRAEFSFSEVENEILEAARSLAPEFNEMTLEQIGNALIERSVQEEHTELVKRFNDLLSQKPGYYFHDGSAGVTEEEDKIVLIFSGEKGNKKTMQLDQDGESGSNYAHTQTVHYEANITAHQLAEIVAVHGIPQNILYTYTNINDWPGQTTVSERYNGTINYSEVENEILEAARSLAPEFSEMTLEQIGNALIEKKPKEESIAE